MTQSVIHFETAEVHVKHAGCTAVEGLALQGHVLTAINCEPNTLTTISVIDDELKLQFHVYWESFEGGAVQFHTLYCNSQKIIFIGCGTISAAVKLLDGQVVMEEAHTLFWAFQRYGDFVLTLGELDCYLHRQNGDRIGHASVDPPYEVEKGSNGITFSSIVAGVQSIQFPESTG